MSAVSRVGSGTERASASDIAAASGARLLQRKCAFGRETISGGECEECRKRRESKLQRSALRSRDFAEVPAVVHEVLAEPGHALDSATRAFMEPRFGRDFSNVRVHTGTKAARSADSVDAQAYTVGSNIAFGEGQFAPQSARGRSLIAHELAHVVQQSNVSSNGPLTLASASAGKGYFDVPDYSKSSSYGKQSFWSSYGEGGVRAGYGLEPSGGTIIRLFGDAAAGMTLNIHDLKQQYWFRAGLGAGFEF